MGGPIYLVTGGAGFIGSHTVALLRERGEAVRVLDDLSTGVLSHLDGMGVEFVRGSIADPSVVADAVAGCSYVIHLAAKPSVPGSCDDPVAYDLVNAHGTVNVFEAARQAGVKQVVYASSSALYGSDPTVPKREEMAVMAESPYAASKAGNELYGRVYTHTLGLPCVGMRYFNVFGARQDPSGPYAGVIAKFVERTLAGLPLFVFGDGEQSRDFVAVRDVARANVLACETPGIGGRVFNIGTGRRTTINELVAYVQRVVGTVPVERKAPRLGDVKVSVADISRALAELDWRPTADFDAAMSETVAWYSTLVAAR